MASAVYSGVLQRQVQGFSRECADVSLTVREALMPDLPLMVVEGRFDVGYIRSPMALPEGLQALRLNAEGFVLALAAGAPEGRPHVFLFGEPSMIAGL